MTMQCPSCDNHQLRPLRLEHDLPALGCDECEGALLSLVAWRTWREHAPASRADDTNDGGVVEAVQDSKALLRCPKCTGLMTKYRFAADTRNQIDFCAHCDEVWLDHGEWELLERFAVDEQLAKVFSQPWQNRVRSEEVKQRAEERWKQQLGAEYERVRAFRSWLAQHQKAREILAYLYQTQTERT